MPESALNLLLCYGSLADPRLLEEGRRGCLRAAIVSPEDTFISVGGGTALAIARAAGYQSIVHDVAKLAPIPLGDVAITSAGKLPVEYARTAEIHIYLRFRGQAKDTIPQEYLPFLEALPQKLVVPQTLELSLRP